MNKKYRLLFTVSEFTFSSQVRNIVDLLSRLDRDLFAIEIGALRIGDEAAAVVAGLGLPYFQFRLLPTRAMKGHDYWAMVKSPFTLVAGRYDLVHSLLYQSVASEAMLVRYLGGAKYVYTKSNLEWDNHRNQWEMKSKLSDCIVSISEATSQLLREQGYGDRVEKIYLGIDTQQFRSDTAKRQNLRAKWHVPESAFVFGCAAQFVEWKEHLTAVRAFELLADKHSDAWLLMCGPDHGDAYYRSCVGYIEASRHSKRIRMLGRLSDMTNFYSGIDVLVLPSRFETFGYVYVEAMSCERPVIGCRAAGPLEIIDENRTGLFCMMSDPVDLSQQMRRYTDNRGLAVAHGLAARGRVEAVFSQDAMAVKSTDLYMRLLTGRRPQGVGAVS